MSKGHRQEHSSRRRRKLTASATGTPIERRKSDSLSSSIFCCISFHLRLKKWFCKLRLNCRKKKKKKAQLTNWISTLFKSRAAATDLMEIFWVCDVIVDVFSQHGCSFIKSYCQTLLRLLSSLFRSCESEMSHQALPACLSTYIHVCWKLTKCRLEACSVLQPFIQQRLNNK